MESFIAGFAYGGTSVLVGQPLDTIKTLQQAGGSASAISSASSTTASTTTTAKKSVMTLARELYVTGGIPAFYRGGVPLLLGGGLMRSAQFGVYNNSLALIRQLQGGPITDPDKYWFRCIDPQVVVAGFMGGIGRGMVEGPFEMVKVRRQVQTQWTLREVMKGFGTTLVRNSFLFASFVVYMDVSDHLGAHLTPFWKGGICSNLAWITIWPLDVVKSRMQSGKFEGKRMVDVLMDAGRSGHLYRGLLPGLVRSFIANGCSMVVYTFVETRLKEQQWGRKE